MISLNLLSEREKEKRKYEDRIGVILRIGFSFIFALLVLLAMTIAAQFVLGIYLESAKEVSWSQTGKSGREISDAEILLKDSNAISQKISKTSKEIPYWSKVIAHISEICPAGLKVGSIHAEKEHLKISGFSKSREAFLELQEKLKGEGYLNFVSPVSNLVSPKDFNFTLEMDLEKNYLTKP